MGINGGPNLQDIFNQRFGANAYQNGIDQARQAGQSYYNAQVQAEAQKLFMQQQSQQQAAATKAAAAQAKLQKPIDDLKNAADYWNQNKDALLQKGAYRAVQDLQNDPELQAQLKAQGYDVKALADQAYNVATGGKIKSADGFKDFYKSQEPDSATRKQNQSEIQDVIDRDAATAAKAKQDAQNKTNFDNSWYGKLLNGIGSGLSDTGNAIGSAVGDVGKSIGNEYNKVANDPQGIGHGLYGAGNDFFNSLNELGNRFDDQLTGTLLSQNQVNKEHQQQQSLLNQLKLNPNTSALAQTNQNIFNQSNSPAKSGLDQLANLSGGFAGNVAPYLVGDGLLGAASKIGKVGELGNLISNPLANKVAGGAISGGVGGGLVSGARAVGGENQSASDVMKNIVDNAAFGAGGEFLLGGGPKSILNNLNLKGQAAKLMQDTGSVKFNPDTFQQALKDTYAPKGDVSNVLADTPKQMPQPFEQKYNLLQQTKVTPTVDSTVQPGSNTNNWFGNTAQPIEHVPQPNVPNQPMIPHALADDTFTKATLQANAPAEGFNQRLLDVQKEMKGLQNNAQSIANKYGGSYTPDVDSLYQQVRKANDPKTFDDLVKNAEMEHSVANPDLKTSLHLDPRIKQQLDALNALGKPSKLVPEVAPKNKGLTIPEVKGAQQQSPHDLLKSLQADKNIKPGGSGGNGLLMGLTPKKLDSIKTTKALETMSKGELQDVMAKLENQESLVSKGGKGSEEQLKKIQADKQKVSDLLMKLDLQKFGANPFEAVKERIMSKAPEKTPQDIAKEKAIAHSKQDNAVKKFEEAGNARKVEAAKNLEGSAEWKDKSAFSYGRETMTRNFEDTMGKDAPKMIKRYIDPIKKGEADRVRFVNNERARVKALDIKPGSKDDKLVQMYGEGKISKDEVRQQAKNPENVLKAADYMRKKYDELLPMINKVLKANGEKEIPFRENYFPHYEEIDGIMHQLGFDMTNHSLPTDINGLTENFKPQKNWTSFAQRRTGDQTSYGFTQGFDKYIEGASNLIHHTKNIKDMRALEDAIREVHGSSTHLSNFVSQLKEYTNQLAGKKAKVDRVFEEAFGRKVFNYLDTIKRKTGMNMVGANVGSAMTNFIPLTQSLATTSKPAFLKGMAETMANIGKNDGFAHKSDFLTKREGTNTLYKTWAEKATGKSMYLMKVLDDFTSNVVVRSKYNEGISKGLSEEEAMKQADTWAEKLMAGRAKGDVPTLMNSKTLGMFSQFQLEVNNQVSFLLKDMPHNAKTKMQLASQMGQVMLYSYLFNNLYEQATGRRPAVDPIGIAKQAFTEYNNPRLKKGTATQNLISNIAGHVPMGDLLASTAGLSSKTSRIPMSSAIPNIANIVSGKSSVNTELLKPLTYLVSPTGGGAIKKAIEGVSAYNAGGVYDGKGNLMYPVDKNAPNAVRGALFGKSSFPGANAYYNNNESPLSAQETKQVQNGARDYQAILQERHNADIRKKIKEVQKNGGDSNKIAKLMAQIKH